MRNTGPTQKVRDAVKERSDGTCERCGMARATEIHHRRNRGMGGTRDASINWLSNLVHLCSPCHRWATVRKSAAHDDGWVIYMGECPRHTAVLGGPGEKVWKVFDDEGGWSSRGPDWSEPEPCDCLGHAGWCSVWDRNAKRCTCRAVAS